MIKPKDSRFSSSLNFNNLKRREFLQFMGVTGLAATALTLPAWLTGCTTMQSSNNFPFRSLDSISKDDLTLTHGFTSNLLMKFGDQINLKGETFGYDNDFIAFLKDPAANSGYLWVNHEFVNPLFVHGVSLREKRSRAQTLLEMKAVGGSLLWATKSDKSWNVDTSSSINRRYDALTPIPFAWSEPIAGSKTAIGTLANCAGGKTPWGTILTCEENYQDFYGEVRFENNKRIVDRKYGNHLNWQHHFDYPPEHYGWVVEIDPKTGTAQKLVSLGRFAHENAVVKKVSDGRLVVYMGDDKADECIYKFISKNTDSLKEGVLYVADTLKGQWLPLDLELSPILKKYFKTQTEVLIRTREAAKILGGTPLARPEGMDIHPKTGALYAALTNNIAKGDVYGSIVKLEEEGADHLSMNFKISSFLTGSREMGFACPDNLIFDRKGNMWFTTDISERNIEEGQYKGLGNNALCYVPFEGPSAGNVYRIAVGPNDCELAGPCFADDGETLFLSVQHPGSGTRNLDNATSHWPEGGGATPKPGIVAITGESMRFLLR